MKKYIFNTSFLAVFSAFLILSCDFVGSSSTEFVNPEITFNSSGVWSPTKALTINQDKKVVLLSSYPNLEIKLTAEEYSRLIDNFKGFSSVTDDREILCNDTTVFTISISEKGIKEEKTFDACYLGDHSTAKPKVKKLLQTIVTSLDELTESIYQTEAPWRGVTAKFSLTNSKKVYSAGEKVEAEYVIHNPTDKVRELWFEHEYPVFFSANTYDYDGEYFYYDYPVRDQTRDSEPTKITLDPGETLTIPFNWDQSIENDGGTRAPVSEYMITLGLSINDFGYENILIELIGE